VLLLIFHYFTPIIVFARESSAHKFQKTIQSDLTVQTKQKKLRCIMKIIAIAAFALVFGFVAGDRLEERYAWKQLEFDWPTGQREEKIASGKYKPENNLPVGIEVWRNKLFMTIPR
jgi:hypothetical protein